MIAALTNKSLVRWRINIKFNLTMKRKFTLTLFAVCAVLFVNAQTADEILAKYFETIGGADKWKALQSRKSTGKMNMQGMDFPLTVFEKAPVKQKVTFQVQGIEIVQGYDGKDAWMVNPMQGGTDPVKLDDEQAKQFKENEFEDEFIDYKKKGHEVTAMGTEEIDGVKCHKIQLVKNKNNDKEDITEVHYFDAENNVPIMYVSYIRSGPSKGQEIKTYLSDYQEVNGLMMPFFVEAKMNGETVQKITIEKVTLDEAMDDTLFAFPKK
jgi:outer membrane lipoprotein-sorting protein